MKGLERQTLLDAAEILRQSSGSYYRNPDCVPESWELGREWISEVRSRAVGLEALAVVLEALAGLEGPEVGES